jgi:DNA-binding CsgD family transcriptional regulator/PAS domain-containing protein
MLDQFSDTIGKIYKAAAGEGRWEEALSSIEETTGSAGAVIGFVPLSADQMALNLAGRFTAEQCAIYSSTYQPICRRTQYMIDHPNLGVIYDDLIISESEMDRDPVYDWFGQHGLRYFVGSALPSTSTHHIVWSLQRSREQGHVQAGDIQLFEHISSHLARALRLADSLGTLRSFEALGWSVVESLTHALYALDPAGRLLFANAAARRLLRRNEGIAIVDGRLSVSRPVEQRELDRLIVDAAGAELGVSSGMCRISRPTGGPPFAVSVAPLHPFSGQGVPGDPAAVAVVVTDPCARQVVEHGLLTNVYGLTDTEARLAEAVAQGHSLDTAAASLGMRVATARTHLKSIFLKLEVNRQQDLVRFLMTLSTLRA